MKISKTKFIYYSKTKNLFSSFNDRLNNEKIDQDTIEKLQELERDAKLKLIFEKGNISQYSSDDIDELKSENNNSNEYMEVMLPYYNIIEEVSARKVKNIFGGYVHFNQNNFKQKYFELKKEEFSFFAFLDTYQEDDHNIRIIETKSTTSSKFVNLTYRENKERKNLFIKNKFGILTLRETAFDNISSSKYFEKRNKLLNLDNEIGKYIYDIAYQGYILNKANKSKKKKEYYLTVLNHEYIFDGSRDKNNEPIYSTDLITLVDVSLLVEEYFPIIENEIEDLITKLRSSNQELMSLDEIIRTTNLHDSNPYIELIGTKNPITELYYSFNGFKGSGNNISIQSLIDEGILEINQVPKNILDKENQIIQYDSVLNNTKYINKENIKKYLKSYNYPIYHLDFETFNSPLPRYKGETAYTQSVYQFSLHVEKAPGVCDFNQDHYYYLAEDHQDHRRDIATKLLEYIKDDGGDIMAYNYGFEKMVLKDLANQFPEFRKPLNKLINRTKDLMHLLKNNSKMAEELNLENNNFNYYDPAQHGSFSIKKVLPTLTSLSYDNLAVRNGNEALISYARLPKLYEQNYEKYKIEYNNMLEYCKQDTWAMVLILNQLRKLVEEEN